jgi:hypothetical protein
MPDSLCNLKLKLQGLFLYLAKWHTYCCVAKGPDILFEILNLNVPDAQKAARFLKHKHGRPGLEGPVICMELKPKWGFLPSTRYMSEPAASINSVVPRFTLHQVWRHCVPLDVLRWTFFPMKLESGFCLNINNNHDDPHHYQGCCYELWLCPSVAVILMVLFFVCLLVAPQGLASVQGNKQG